MIATGECISNKEQKRRTSSHTIAHVEHVDLMHVKASVMVRAGV